MIIKTKITTAIIALQIANNLLHDLKAENYFEETLSNKINAVLPELVEVEKEHYDRFFNIKDADTNEVYRVYDNFLQVMAQIPIYDCESIVLIYEVYKKNPKALEVAINKILKTK